MSQTLAVLITYHNEGPLLRECLESLLAGERLAEEIFVYDDCSEIEPRPFVPEGMPVTIIRGAVNAGPSYGRNALLRASGATFVHFHDADDTFAPGWCDQVRRTIAQDNSDAVFTEVIAYENGKRSGHPIIGLEELRSRPDLIRFCLHHALLPACGTYRRESVLAIGGYSTKYVQSEDFDFNLRLALKGLRYSLILDPLVLQRRHAGNRSGDRLRVWTDAVLILETLAPELGAAYSQDVCDALARAGGILHRMGAVAEARNAFSIADRLGRPRFTGESLAYRTVARFFGPRIAERIGGTYRHLLPAGVRELARTERPNV